VLGTHQRFALLRCILLGRTQEEKQWLLEHISKKLWKQMKRVRWVVLMLGKVKGGKVGRELWRK
jgi:hypothetical protein